MTNRRGIGYLRIMWAAFIPFSGHRALTDLHPVWVSPGVLPAVDLPFGVGGVLLQISGSGESETRESAECR